MDWDKRYLENDIPWDKGAPAPILANLLSNGVFPSLETKPEILVPGCGHGHDVREIAAAGYQTTGIDISGKALQTAQFLAQNDKRITYAKEDLFDKDLPDKKCYDLIWEHTCYCAISPGQRAEYVEAVFNLLKPDGVLLGVFFVAEQEKLGPPHMTNREDLLQIFSERFELLWEKAPEVYYPARAGKEWLMCWSKKALV